MLNSRKLSVAGGTIYVCIPAGYSFELQSTIIYYLLDPGFIASHWQVEVIGVAAPFVVHLLQALFLNLAVIVARWARRNLNKINTREDQGFLQGRTVRSVGSKVPEDHFLDRFSWSLCRAIHTGPVLL